MQADFVPKNQWPGFIKFEGEAAVSLPWPRSNPHGGRFGVAEGENVIPLIESLVVSWLSLASRFSLLGLKYCKYDIYESINEVMSNHPLNLHRYPRLSQSYRTVTESACVACISEDKAVTGGACIVATREPWQTPGPLCRWGRCVISRSQCPFGPGCDSCKSFDDLYQLFHCLLEHLPSEDYHPHDHCSFNSAGGPFPPHCVQGSMGSCLTKCVCVLLFAYSMKYGRR